MSDWRDTVVAWPDGLADGVLLVDKPSGPTSHDIVAAVRSRVPKGRKVGHAGTLDPFASGLLIVLVGRATRVQRLLMGQAKTYEVVAHLGHVSDTGDRDGTITATGNVPPDPPDLPTGGLMQRPPAYSAIKVGGRRAYQLARAGHEVELEPREVEVTRFEQTTRRGDVAEFAIACSSGTYVRSLIADLGDAYCQDLRRTSIGPFEVGSAGPHPLELVDVLRQLLPVVECDSALADSIGHGQRPEAPADAPQDTEFVCVDPEGQPVALVQVSDGHLVSSVGFR